MNQDKRPSAGSFKVFGTLRSPKNLNESPPTPLPIRTPAPVALEPTPQVPYYSGQPVPIPNPSPALNPQPINNSINSGLSGSISQKPIMTNPPTIKLLPPESASKNSTLKRIEEKPVESKEPPLKSQAEPSKINLNQKQPLDIPGYALINNSMAMGLLPYPDGVEWLVKEKFKSALFIYSSNQETKAIVSLFEKRGMKLNLLLLEESNLSAERLNIEFLKLQNTNEQPIYVFDLDGSIAASFWYVYYGKSGNKSEAEILDQFTKLGLDPSKSEQSKAIFKAAKKMVW